MSADKFALAEVPTEEIKQRLAKARQVHPMEPCRVAMYVGALAEVERLRELIEKGGVSESDR